MSNKREYTFYKKEERKKRRKDFTILSQKFTKEIFLQLNNIYYYILRYFFVIDISN